MNLAVILVYLVGVLAMGLVMRLIPGASALQAELGASPTQMGLILGLVGLPGLLGPLVGAIADRIGPALLLLITGLIAAAASLLLTVTPSIGPIFAVRVLEGIAFVGLATAVPVLMLRLTEGKAQVAAMALWSTAPPVGGALAFALAGGLGAAAWRPLFIVYAVAFALFSVAAYLSARRKSAAAGLAAPHAPFKASALLSAYTDLPLLRLALAYMALTTASLGFVTVFPQLAAQVLGWSGQATASILGAANLAVIPGAAIGGFLLGKTGAFRRLVAGSAVLLALCALVFYSPIMGAAAITAAIFGHFVLQGSAGTVMMAALPRVAPIERRGLAIGVLGQFASLAVIIAAPIWISLHESGGATALTIGGVAAVLLMAVLFPATREPASSEAAAAPAPGRA